MDLLDIYILYSVGMITFMLYGIALLTAKSRQTELPESAPVWVVVLSMVWPLTAVVVIATGLLSLKNTPDSYAERD